MHIVGGNLTKLAGPLTTTVADIGGIEPDRIFINLTNFSGADWARNGGTF